MAQSEVADKPLNLNWVWLGLVSLAYIALTFYTPVRPNKYNLTLASTRLIQVSFVIPILLIWWLAMYGANRFKHYAISIEGSPDGRALSTVADGLLILLYGGFISSLFSSFRAYLPPGSSLIPFTIMGNYLAMIFPLVSFIVIYRGSKRLVSVVGAEKQAAASRLRALIPFILFSALFLVLLFKDPHRGTSPDVGTVQSFFLNDPALLLTLVIPYLVAWFYGSLAVTYIKTFAKVSKGTIYRKAITRLANGFLAVIIFSILLQTLGTLSTAFSNASLGAILVFIYVILVAYGLAYLIIASGARELRKIEEVV